MEIEMFWKKKKNKTDEERHKPYIPKVDPPPTMETMSKEEDVKLTVIFMEVRKLREDVHNSYANIAKGINSIDSKMERFVESMQNKEGKTYAVTYADKTLKWIILDLRVNPEAKIVDVGFNTKEEALAEAVIWAKENDVK